MYASLPFRLLVRALVGVAVALPLPAAGEGGITDIEVLAEQLVSRDLGAARKTLAHDVALMAGKLSAGELLAEGSDHRTRLLLHTVLGRLPVETISEPEWLAEHGEFLDWLLLSPDRLGLLLSELRPEDQPARVLEVWSGIWQREEKPEFRDKYASLALALALIYDVPGNAPAKADTDYHPSLDCFERYEFFKQASEDQKLAVPSDRLVPRDLIHVVDLVVSREEIDWSLSKLHENRRSWGRTYSEIEYLMERAVDGVDPYESYILSEILKEGGICGDQAYFASESGKAQGIPTASIVGVGSRGAHAWVAFMPDDHEWETHGSQGITNGDLYDAQRGRQITHDLLRLEADKDYRPEQRVPALLITEAATVAARAGHRDKAAELFATARKLSPLSLEPWEAQFEFMLGADDPAALAGFLDGVERDFGDYPSVVEVASGHRREHLLAHLSEEDLMKELEREIRRNIRKYEDQGEVVANSVSSLAEVLVKKDSPEGLRRLFKTAFRKCGEDLELFEKLMDNYLRSSRKFADLKAVVPSDLERFYDRYAETGSAEYFRGMMEIKLHRTVARAYRDAGEIRKADSLDKKIERREEDLAKDAL